ncbi:MAG: phage holin family protein, partial [Armatimonadetes bacterium]|nr:phage holin family protein [Armatimonadota bacterium]
FILGVAASVKRRGWGAIKSRVMIRSAWKMIAYGGSLAAAWGIDTAVRAGDAAQLAIALLACLTEAHSVAENSGKLGFSWPQALVSRLDEWEEQVQKTGRVSTMEVTAGEEEDDNAGVR